MNRLSEVRVWALRTLENIGGPENQDYGRHEQGDTLEHAVWMLRGISEGYVTDEKAHRWLGYAQALAVLHTDIDIDLLKIINRPEGT